MKETCAASWILCFSRGFACTISFNAWPYTDWNMNSQTSDIIAMGTRMCLWDMLYRLSTRPERERERAERAAQLCACATFRPCAVESFIEWMWSSEQKKEDKLSKLCRLDFKCDGFSTRSGSLRQFADVCITMIHSQQAVFAADGASLCYSILGCCFTGRICLACHTCRATPTRGHCETSGLGAEFTHSLSPRDLKVRERDRLWMCIHLDYQMVHFNKKMWRKKNSFAFLSFGLVNSAMHFLLCYEACQRFHSQGINMGAAQPHDGQKPRPKMDVLLHCICYSFHESTAEAVTGLSWVQIHNRQLSNVWRVTHLPSYHVRWMEDWHPAVSWNWRRAQSTLQKRPHIHPFCCRTPLGAI